MDAQSWGWDDRNWDPAAIRFQQDEDFYSSLEAAGRGLLLEVEAWRDNRLVVVGRVQARSARVATPADPDHCTGAFPSPAGEGEVACWADCHYSGCGWPMGEDAVLVLSREDAERVERLAGQPHGQSSRHAVGTMVRVVEPWGKKYYF